MRLSHLAILGAGLLALAPMAQAADQDFTVVNKTGYEINDIWVSAAASESWGDELMGKGNTLSDGDSLDISFPHGTDSCHFDMKVRYLDKDVSTWSNLDLCSISKISLFWDRKAGVTRARTE
jgi:hypothetical protein